VLRLSSFWVTGRTVGCSETLTVSVFHVKTNVINEDTYSLSPGLKLITGYGLLIVCGPAQFFQITELKLGHDRFLPHAPQLHQS